MVIYLCKIISSYGNEKYTATWIIFNQITMMIDLTSKHDVSSPHHSVSDKSVMKHKHYIDQQRAPKSLQILLICWEKSASPMINVTLNWQLARDMEIQSVEKYDLQWPDLFVWNCHVSSCTLWRIEFLLQCVHLYKGASVAVLALDWWSTGRAIVLPPGAWYESSKIHLIVPDCPRSSIALHCRILA